MASIHPQGWRELLDHAPAGELPPARRRELETLARLAATLSDDCAIYHGIHWARIEGERAILDDIDFIVVGPGGRVLLIEQAAGFLEERPEGLVRRHGGRELPVAARLVDVCTRFEGRLRRALGAAESPAVEMLFFCPDYSVRDGGTAGLPPERIVDSTQREALPSIVRRLVEGPASPPASRARLHRFLVDLLGLVPDAGAVIGAAEALTMRLSGGLADWARRIDCTPFRLRVIGTAGSGKTQLAVAAFRDALASGRRALYVCYNRPLADHVAAILGLDATKGEKGLALTFHQLADRVARSRGERPDFSQADAFDRLEESFLRVPPDTDWRFDELIVDEGQDFPVEWAHALLGLLRENGRAWWLEDPMQNLYDRQPVRLPGWVELAAPTNFRSPRAIAKLLARLQDSPVECGSPFDGGPVEILEYADDAGLVEQTKRAIGMAIAAGFRREAIALLSYRGRERSILARLERLGPYRLRRFTGRYDLLGIPEQSDGDIAFDTVMRFKGRSAPCVILSEVDFPGAPPPGEGSAPQNPGASGKVETNRTLETAIRRRIFVGASRATLRLLIVAGPAAAAELRSLLA